MPRTFFSQRIVDAALFGDPFDQALRGMRVQVVNNENPFTCGIDVHGSRDVVDEFRFGAGRLQRGGDDLAGHHVEAGGQRGGAMTRVLELLLGHAAGLNGLVGGIAFDGLERRRLIHAHRVSAVDRGLARGFEIRLADRGGLALEGRRDSSPSC